MIILRQKLITQTLLKLRLVVASDDCCLRMVKSSSPSSVDLSNELNRLQGKLDAAGVRAVAPIGTFKAIWSVVRSVIMISLQI